MENSEQTSSTTVIYCDNLKAVKEVSNKSPIDIKTATTGDGDIMLEIKDILKKLQTTTTLSWVKGHYNGTEKHIKYRLNRIAHDAAVGFLKATPKGSDPLWHQLRPVSHRVSVYHNNELITSGLKPLVHRIYYFPPLIEKLKKDNNWTDPVFYSIDWDSFQSAMNSMGSCEKVSICKLTNRLWNTNSQNHRYYGRAPNCP
jgi:hypothetical protein